jgi:hypothetical protein
MTATPGRSRRRHQRRGLCFTRVQGSNQMLPNTQPLALWVTSADLLTCCIGLPMPAARRLGGSPEAAAASAA